MFERAGTELAEQGRGIVGALLVVGVADLYTMEMWWHGWQLPAWHLVVYAVGGLGTVLLIANYVGFRDTGEDDPAEGLGSDFAELLLQSFLAAAIVLVLFGVVDQTSSLLVIARQMLVYVVPLGLGAAMANELLTGEPDRGEVVFPKNLGLFALGAAFIVGPISPTEEMELIATHAGWWRLAAFVPASVVVTYLMLFELEFKGQRRRVRSRSRIRLLADAVTAYAVALVVAAGLLASYGHFMGSPVEIWLQETVVLGFPATIGASAAQVVVG